MPFDIDPALFALLIVAAIFAGWVDAVVGGGGLIQLPALLVAFPTAPPALMLGTNKMASVCGTTISAVAGLSAIRCGPRVPQPRAPLGAVLSPTRFR